MSTCSKCGVTLSDERYLECADEDTQFSEAAAYQECLERQLSNLRSLLRSVTGKLERVSELMDTPLAEVSSELVRAKALVDSVLEALS